MVEVYIVRHGQTLGNKDKILQGHRDGQLSEVGEEQALQTGKFFSDFQFNFAYVSDLGRTKKTYELLASNLNKKIPDVQFIPLLREKNGGVLEGQPLIAWENNAKEAKIPLRQYKCENGECWNDVSNRALKFLQLLVAQHITSNQAEQIKKTEYEEQKMLEPEIQAPKTSKQEVRYEKVKVPEKRSLSFTSKQSAKEHSGFGLQLKGIKKCSFYPEKKITSQVKGHNFPKILVVSHGGFIMELFNQIKNWNKASKLFDEKNSAMNCSISIIKVYCSKTQGRCAESCINEKCINIEIIKRNMVDHLVVPKKIE